MCRVGTHGLRACGGFDGGGGLQNRDKHDFLLSVIPLIEHPPWTRARQDGTKRIWQKLDNGEWTDVPHDRLLDVTKLEAQAWLALYHLTLHPEVRKRYGFDAYRKQTLLRARRFINDVLLDAQPTKEFVTSEQVAALALYLCRDEAKAITGANLSVDGGWTAA